MQPAYQPWLFAFAVVVALSTLGLIGMGGLVTSHGVGMAVPDWPTTYGYNMFLFPIAQWIGGIFYEHSHRLYASVVGMLTVILGVWLGWKEPRRWLKGLGALAVLLVIFQGVLGGLRVVWLMDELGIVHATLAQLFLVLMSAIAVFCSRWWIEGTDPVQAAVIPRGMRRLVWFTTALIFAQLVLGATMRHQHAGLAVPDFPLAYGRLWPATDPESITQYNRARLEIWDYAPVTAAHIWMHMGHRLMALVIVIFAVTTAWKTWGGVARPAWVRRGVGVWLGMIFLQACLGAATVWSNKAADVATLHVVMGAATLVWGAMHALCAWKFSIDGAALLGHSADRISETTLGRAKPVFSTGRASI